MVIIAQKNKHGVNNKEGMTMKKMITNMKALAALLMVGAAVTSCSSDDSIIGEPDAPQVYTMTVEASKGTNGTRTLALADGGTTLTSTWTAGDKVKVYNSSDTELGELTAQTDGASTTLRGTLDELPSDGDELTLKYLSPDYDTQDGTLTGTENSIDKVCDYATATVTATVNGSSVTTPNASFVNQQAVVKFTLTDNAATPNAISPTALTVSDGTHTVSLTIPDATYTTNGDGVVYVAIPGFSGKTVSLSATVGSDTYTYDRANVTFENGNFYRITVKMSNGTLSGKFTINGSGGKVQFAKGNLQYTKSTSTWSFMDHQYSTVETLNQNVGTDYADQDVVSLFGWGTSNQTIANYGTAYQPWSTNTTSTDYGPFGEYNLTGTYANGDWGVNMGSDWRTLTRGEWTYVFGTNSGDKRSGATVGATSNARYTYATINTDGTGVNGIILFPDGATFADTEATWDKINSRSSWRTKCTKAQWSALEAKGCVFLPATGYRNVSSVKNVGYEVRYWSSTAYGTEGAYTVYFVSDYLNIENSSNRYYGYSVRLVRPVE